MTGLQKVLTEMVLIFIIFTTVFEAIVHFKFVFDFKFSESFLFHIRMLCPNPNLYVITPIYCIVLEKTYPYAMSKNPNLYVITPIYCIVLEKTLCYMGRHVSN